MALMMVILLWITTLTMISTSLIIWWSVTVVLTTILLIQTVTQKMMNPSLNYFIIQEMLGLLFICWSTMMNSSMIVLVLFLKMGIPPFYFWINKMYSEMTSFIFLWIMNLQKVPLMLMSIELIKQSTIPLLMGGMILSFMNILTSESMKQILLISSSSSSAIPLLISLTSTLEGILMFMLYMATMYMLLQESKKEMEMNQTTILMLVLLSIPMTIIFMIKITTVMILSSMMMTIFLLTTMILSILSYTKFLQKSMNLEEDWKESTLKTGTFLMFLTTLTL